MKKTVFTFLAVALASSFAYSQTVDDGIKFLYYGRTKSAVAALEKVEAGKPKDGLSIYWLAEAYVRDYFATDNADDLTKAKTLVQGALQGGANDPWVWVASGTVTIAEGGDINAAKQNFEQAITATKGKKGIENADILNAVGRAQAQGGSKFGDPQYGVDKLKRAAELDAKNPEIEFNLGVCYAKLGSENGGEAVQAFNDAIARDPKYAAAYYEIGLIYKSQDNKDAMDEWFGKAIAADQTYGPVYYGYYAYYSEKDVNAAKDYIDKYIANSDQDCKTSYFDADYLFRAGKYQESLDKAKAMEAGDCKSYARIYLLYAYDYDRLGDSVQARTDLQKFFATATSFQPDDYEFAGKLYSKFNPIDTALVYLQKAIDADTIKKNKIDYANTAINILAKAGRIRDEWHWYSVRSTLAGEAKLSESDFYKLGNGAVTAITSAPADSVSIMNAYKLADSVGNAYIAAYPDKPQGYSIIVNAAKTADRDSTWGLAITPIATANTFYLKDTSAFSKNSVFRNDYYLVFYYLYHVKGMARIDQYRKAVILLDEMKSVSTPGTDTYDFAQKTGDQLRGAVQKYDAAHNKAGGTSSSSAAPAGKSGDKK